MNSIAVLIIILSASILVLFIVVLKFIFSPKKISKIKKNIKAGKYNLAIKGAKALILKNSKNSQARFLLGKAYLADKKADLAFNEFKILNKTAVFDNLATEIEFRDIIADLYIKFHHPDEALKEYIILNKKAPNNPKYYYEAGKLYEEKNMSDYAIKYFQDTITMDSRFAPAYASMGLLLFKSQKFAEAEKAIKTALKLDPENHEILYYNGKILRGKKDYGRALLAFEKAARRQDLRTKCFLERGCCFVETSNFEKALFEFSRAIKSSKIPSTQEVLYSRYLMAECYEKQREVDKAIKQWEAIYAVNPKFKNIKQKLNEYDDLRTNDYMKEYLTLVNEEFYQMCRDITSQYFNFAIQAVKDLKIGCSIFALEKGTEQWLNARKKPHILIFSRDGNVITESFLRSIQEQMKKQTAVNSHIISSADFSKNAIKFAENRPFELIDRKELQKILDKVKFGF